MIDEDDYEKTKSVAKDFSYAVLGERDRLVDNEKIPEGEAMRIALVAVQSAAIQRLEKVIARVAMACNDISVSVES